MFNDRYGLTDAVLDGRKTMTRRGITAPDKWHGIEVYGFSHVKGEHTLTLTDGDDFIIEDPDTGEIGQILPTYKIGEEVAIAQKYWDLRNDDAFYEALAKADPSFPIECIEGEKGCNNKMFVKASWMPHRIRITDIKIEHLQDITEEDCMREGIEWCHGSQSYYVNYIPETGFRYWLCGQTAREAFAALIDKVSGKGTWESNPYVWVYSFELSM